MSAHGESPAVTHPDEAPIFGSFVSGVLLTLGTRIFMLVGVFGSSIIVARLLGPEGFGVFAVLNVTVALALQIGSAGLPSANTYFLARDRRKFGSIWANSIIFALLVGVLLAATVMVLGWFRPALFAGVSTELLLVAAVSIPFQLLFVLGLNVLLAIDRIRQLNLFDALLPALVLLNAIVVLILLGERLFLLVSFNTIAGSLLSLFVAVYIALELRKVRQKFQLNAQLLGKMLRYGLKFYISIMAGTIIFRADLLIVNHFRGATEAGVYAVASQFSFLLLMLPSVIATLLFPRIAAEQDVRGEFAVRVTRHTTVIMLVVCVAAALFSFALPLIYGTPFSPATMQLLILLPGMFFIGLESVLVQHFTGTGLPVAIPLFWLVTLAFNISANLLTVPRFGATAAAVTSSLSYAMIFLLVVVYFCRQTGREPSELFIWRSEDLRTMWRTARGRLAGSLGA